MEQDGRGDKQKNEFGNEDKRASHQGDGSEDLVAGTLFTNSPLQQRFHRTIYFIYYILYKLVDPYKNAKQNIVPFPCI